MFGPRFDEDYERIRDKIENAIDLLAKSVTEIKVYVCVAAVSLFVIATSVTMIMLEKVF